MLTIWKFKLELQSEQFIEIPSAHRFICVGRIENELFAWAEIGVDCPHVKAKIVMFMTGFRMHGPHINRRYIGSVLSGEYHFYEEI
jgi:hypothetical protein